MNEIISLSHTDLDMLGCELVLHWKFGNNISHYNTNYRNIPEIIFNMEQEIHKNDPKVIIISDVSMADNRAELLEIASFNLPVIFLDHHEYPEGYFNDLPENITYVHDKNRCGSQITYDFFKCDNENLGKMISIINAYDLWLKKSPLFPLAFNMNKYFWEMGHKYMIEAIINNNYDLPSNYQQIVDSVNNKNAKILESLKNKNLIHRNGDISIAFTDDILDEVVFYEMDNGAEIVLVCTSYGHIKVRIKEDGIHTDEFKHKLKQKLGCEKIGHLNAFPYIIKKANFERLMEHVKVILKAVEET